MSIFVDELKITDIERWNQTRILINTHIREFNRIQNDGAMLKAGIDLALDFEELTDWQREILEDIKSRVAVENNTD